VEQDTWRPDQIVFPGPKISISVDGYGDRTFSTANPRGFTALDLFFQINSWISPLWQCLFSGKPNPNVNLDDIDVERLSLAHNFYEGMFHIEESLGEIPVYGISMGS